MTEADPRIEKLKSMQAASKLGGGQERIDKQHAKGSLTARERIDLLLDPDTFREIGSMASQQNPPEGDETLGDGVVTGYGSIDGRTVYVYAQDFTVQGGSLGEMHAQKICRVRTSRQDRLSNHRHDRFRRRAHPGRRQKPWRLRADLPPQCHLLGCGAPNQPDHGPLRRRRFVFSGCYRSDHHG